MQLGRVFKEFCAKDGQKAILRTPTPDDLNDLMELINSLVDEKAEINCTVKVTREEEAEWLRKILVSLKKNKIFFLVAEVNKKVVASADINIQSEEEKQVGVIGIAIKNGFRNLGIGTEIMKILLEQAAFLKLKALTLSVFATNKQAIHVYEKAGFVQTDRILKKHFRQGRYIDEVIMTKVIK
jgi:RimJ/RimL family protein N-acetyltransferase